eukprot:2171827-Heterocapsa_arctica.AAC.1
MPLVQSSAHCMVCMVARQRRAVSDSVGTPSRGTRTIEAHDRGLADFSAPRLEANANHQRGRVPSGVRMATGECRMARAGVAAAPEGPATCGKLRRLCLWASEHRWPGSEEALA